MQPLLTASESKRADSRASSEFGIPPTLLMEHAALALVARLQARFGGALPKTRGLVVAGSGNNGGDVLAAARLLTNLGLRALTVVRLGSEKGRSELNEAQSRLLIHAGIQIHTTLDLSTLSNTDWVLDGLLGTGTNRELSGWALEGVNRINQAPGAFSRPWVVSADVPSGICSDTGKVWGQAVQANETVCFGQLKRGVVTGAAVGFVGEVFLAPIHFPPQVWEMLSYRTWVYGAEQAKKSLPARPADGHKGLYGKVGVVAGPATQEGAAALAALAALRMGAGLACVAAEVDQWEVLRTRLAPEIMLQPFSHWLDSPPSAAVVGPGLGIKNGKPIMAAALELPCPLVLDADALSLLADPDLASRLIARQKAGRATVLTPHPKEAARLLALPTETIQADRFQSVKTLWEKYGCPTVLKGAGTLCKVEAVNTWAVGCANASLSKGGTGDVLAGVIAALLAQGVRAEEAVPLGVYIHSKAGQRCTERFGHTRSALASEVAAALSIVLRELECTL